MILNYKEAEICPNFVPSLALFFLSQAQLLIDAMKVPRTQTSISLFPS